MVRYGGYVGMSLSARDELLDEVREKLKDKLTVTGLEQVIDTLDDSIQSFDVERIANYSGAKFKDLMEAFLSAKAVEGRSPKTIERYRYALERLDKHLGVPIDKITVFHLRQYLSDMKERGWSDRTMEGIRSVFCSFFGWCHRENLLKQNPTGNLGAIKYRKKIRLPFSSVDIELLKTGCKDLRDLVVVNLLYCSGIRVNELCLLNIDSVDFEAKEISVLGKGNKERTVFMDDVTSMLLKKYLNERDDPYEALIVGKGIDRVTPPGVRAMLKRVENRVEELSNVHPHRFRRTLATGLLNKGMPIQEVACILGHENINTTMTYVHVDKQSVKSDFSKYFGNV